MVSLVAISDLFSNWSNTKLSVLPTSHISKITLILSVLHHTSVEVNLISWRLNCSFVIFYNWRSICSLDIYSHWTLSSLSYCPISLSTGNINTGTNISLKKRNSLMGIRTVCYCKLIVWTIYDYVDRFVTAIGDSTKSAYHWLIGGTKINYQDPTCWLGCASFLEFPFNPCKITKQACKFSPREQKCVLHFAWF